MTLYAFYPFEFGLLKIGYSDGTVVSLNRVMQPDAEHLPCPLTENVFAQIVEYLAGQRKNFDFPYILYGTPFQKKVWRALCDIPYGETRSYKQLAEAVDNPNACRAVGMANHRNPMMIVVPCHRVVGASGKLTGYTGGLEMKAALLKLEHGATAQ
ncbi:methylated-DNA--[protein]-cysteine S-methyltransferase [Oscillospiraceae bacterium LTW-04]|nr:methylated-DNA--[protein]-cysteine S-methyltransferase [Oscillospiraceae bacterium MB24-C1]